MCHQYLVWQLQASNCVNNVHSKQVVATSAEQVKRTIVMGSNAGNSILRRIDKQK